MTVVPCESETCPLSREKACYPTRAAAQAAADEVRRKRNRPGHDQSLHVYLCWRCGRFHYGHRPPGRRSPYSAGYFPPGLWEAAS